MRVATPPRDGDGETARRLLPTLRRPRGTTIGYAVFTVCVFLLALAYSLPHDLIARRALEAATAGAPFQATFQDVGFAFPNGYRFTGLRLTPTRAPEATISLSELTVRTPLTGLLVGRADRANFSGQAYGGTLSGSVEPRGDRTALHLDLRGADLSRALSGVVPPPGRVLGKGDLQLDLSGDGRSTQSSEGDVRLSVSGLKLQEIAVRGILVPDLSFPDLALSAQLFGGRLQVKELQASGDELDLGATGDVLLREPPPTSVLNLRLTIDVSPTAPPPLRVATALLPRRAAGEKPTYTLTGTISAPVLR